MKEFFIKPWIVFLFLLILGTRCETDKVSRCSDSYNLGAIVKSVADKKGIIWYDSKAQAYSIFVGIEGSYDSQDIGVICNISDNYKKEGLEVLFSGDYYTCNEFIPDIPGQTYYFLELTKVKFLQQH